MQNNENIKELPEEKKSQNNYSKQDIADDKIDKIFKFDYNKEINLFDKLEDDDLFDNQFLGLSSCF